MSHTPRVCRRPLTAVLMAMTVVSVAVACTPPPLSPPTPTSRCAFARTLPEVSTEVVGVEASNLLTGTAVLGGIDRWNNAPHQGPRLVGPGRPETITFSGYRDVNSNLLGVARLPACGPSGWLGNPTVEINIGRLFTLGNPAGLESAVWVGSHEIGHALGLDHPPGQDPFSSCPGTVMWLSNSVFTRCGVDGPTAIDTAAINDLYD